MDCRAPIAKLVVSVDLELPRDSLSVFDERRLEATTAWLLGLLRRLDMPATVAIADPAHSAATDVLVAESPRIEVAILGEASWAGPTAGPGRFARELTRRIAGADAAGIPVTTLLLRDGAAVDCYASVLSRCGITAIGQLVDGGQVPQQPILSLSEDASEGALQLPPAVALPANRGWLAAHLAAWRSHRTLRQAIKSRETLHVAVNAADLSSSGASAKRRTEKFLGAAADCRTRGELRIHTIRELASEHPHVAKSRSSDSMLTRAA